MKHLLAALSLLACLSCGTAPAGPDGLIYPSAASIRVTRAPTADFAAADVSTVEVVEAGTVRQWRATLDAVPEEPLRGPRNISFLPETVEYRIEFLDASGEAVGSHRMKGSCLDIAGDPSWSFYSGEDRAFVALVEGLFAEG